MGFSKQLKVFVCVWDQLIVCEHLQYQSWRRSATTTKVRADFIYDYEAKCLNNILKNLIEEWIEQVVHYDKTAFIRGMKGQFSSRNFIN